MSYCAPFRIASPSTRCRTLHLLYLGVTHPPLHPIGSVDCFCCPIAPLVHLSHVTAFGCGVLTATLFSLTQRKHLSLKHRCAE